MQQQCGSVSTEWLVVTAALVVALFVPFDGHASVAAMLIEAVKVLNANTMYPLSLP
jgi:hypothetical protein